jgi:hypothetical protein
MIEFWTGLVLGALLATGAWAFGLAWYFRGRP